MASLNDIENQKGNEIVHRMYQFFLVDLVFTSECPYYCFQVSYARAQLQQNNHLH